MRRRGATFLWQVDPLDVAEGASRGLHAVGEGAGLTVGASHDGPEVSNDPSNSARRLFFGTKDAAVARWDAPLPFPTPLHRQPELAAGLSYVSAATLTQRLGEVDGAPFGRR